MLQIKNIRKEYKTGGLVQKALDGVSLNLRDNEFVAILGPSGSGKTTLLNIIGGLDRYDSGDLIINGVSTKKYKDRDWDSYRNHSVGFVFQSYNLIPHQTVLRNVELALTISGVSRKERRSRAMHALEQVGLGAQAHKKPNQMSGGQMQRVAIARALVNNPDILLADEPTGALDTETSVQVMELLKEVARDRLVVMVTHNPELAEAYATRIVKLRDGKIIGDSDEFVPDVTGVGIHKNMGHASMSPLTALQLSFNNLWTKKTRTVLVAFAGSIGIIGIALILSLANGVNKYIEDTEEETLSEYPIEIYGSSFSLSSMLDVSDGMTGDYTEDGIQEVSMLEDLFAMVDTNDLYALREYIESGSTDIYDQVTAIEYTYDMEPLIYSWDGETYRQVNPNDSLESLGLSSASMFMMGSTGINVFFQLPETESLYTSQYDLKCGRWPENSNECIVVTSALGGISDFLVYTLGLRDAAELDDMIDRFAAGENFTVAENDTVFDYEDVLGITFKVVGAYNCYTYDGTRLIYTDRTDDADYMSSMVEAGYDLEVVGVAVPRLDSDIAMLDMGIWYTPDLISDLRHEAEDSEIVKAQLASPDVNVLTGTEFGEEEEDFDMDSIFTIDEDALSAAFKFDESSLEIDTSVLEDLDLDLSSVDLSSLDFSSLDLSGIDMDEEEMSKLFESAMADVDVESLLKTALADVDLESMVDSEAMSSAMDSIAQGYSEYLGSDTISMSDAYAQYLASDEASAIMSASIASALASSGTSLDPDSVSSAVENILSGYNSYVEANGITDPENISAYLNDYLASDAAQTLINTNAETLINSALSNVSLSEEQMSSMMDSLAAGYESYASSNNLPSTSSLSEYLSSDSAQQLITSAVSSAIDTSALNDALSAAVSEYAASIMSDVMTQVMGSVSEELGNQIGSALTSAMTSAMTSVTEQLSEQIPKAMETVITDSFSSMEDLFEIDDDAFADAFKFNIGQEELASLLTAMMSGDETTLDSNLSTFGYVPDENLSKITIYPKDFECKTRVTDILEEYNRMVEDAGEPEKAISYTDIVGILMSSVTKIVDAISYVLVAFVAISLIVSSIMIGVITYISVLERRKEIGILRAMGASKRNIGEVFNAETIITGFLAGLFGVGIAELLLIPGNRIIHSATGIDNINCILPITSALLLIALSIVLTFIGGLIPSRKASKSDPVKALRSE